MFQTIKDWFLCRFRDRHRYCKDKMIPRTCPDCEGRGVYSITHCCGKWMFIHDDSVTDLIGDDELTVGNSVYKVIMANMEGGEGHDR